MERWFNRISTAIIAVCAVISAVYAVLAYTESTAPTATSAAVKHTELVPNSPPWWVITIGMLAIGLFVFNIFRWLGFSPKMQGIEFFQTRRLLDKKYPTVGSRIQNASTVWAIWAVGTRFIDSPAIVYLTNPNQNIARAINSPTHRRQVGLSQAAWHTQMKTAAGYRLHRLQLH